ncbi:MAG: DUF2029 domain-containing protein [Burkholderiaceae bacterium]|nr:DUF2029 domain-containing protein [Burkholderiaceae bacterium]
MAAEKRAWAMLVDPDRSKTIRSASGPLRAMLVGLALGASLLFAIVCLAIVFRFGDRDVGTDRPIVRNDFVAFQAIALLAERGRPELAYDPHEVLALERDLAKDRNLEWLPAAYPPSFAWMIRPLALLDVVDAYRLWAASTLGAAALVALLITRRWWALPGTLLMPAVAFCASVGQNGNLSAALLGAGMWLLQSHPVSAGIAFGLMTYKPQLAVALPFCLLAGGHLRVLASAAATAVAIILASVAAFGPAPLFAFLSNLGTQADLFFGSATHLWHRMPTVMAGVLQLTGHRTLATALHAAVALAAFVALVSVWRHTDRTDLRALGLVASMPLVSPYFFDYDLAVGIVPIALLAGRAAESGLTWPRLLVMAALWMTPPFLTYAPAGFRWPVAPLIWALLLGYALLEARRIGE